MSRKRNYSTPDFSRVIYLSPENSFMQASVVDNITQIDAMGQTVVENDFTQSGFNHNWDED